MAVYILQWKDFCFFNDFWYTINWKSHVNMWKWIYREHAPQLKMIFVHIVFAFSLQKSNNVFAWLLEIPVLHRGIGTLRSATANLDDGVLQTKTFFIQNKENKSFSAQKVVSAPSSFCIQHQSGHFHVFRTTWTRRETWAVP